MKNEKRAIMVEIWPWAIRCQTLRSVGLCTLRKCPRVNTLCPLTIAQTRVIQSVAWAGGLLPISPCTLRRYCWLQTLRSTQVGGTSPSSSAPSHRACCWSWSRLASRTYVYSNVYSNVFLTFGQFLVNFERPVLRCTKDDFASKNRRLENK